MTIEAAESARERLQSRAMDEDQISQLEEELRVMGMLLRSDKPEVRSPSLTLVAHSDGSLSTHRSC